MTTEMNSRLNFNEFVKAAARGAFFLNKPFVLTLLNYLFLVKAKILVYAKKIKFQNFLTHKLSKKPKISLKLNTLFFQKFLLPTIFFAL